MPKPNPRWSSTTEGSILFPDPPSKNLPDPSSKYSRFLRHHQEIREQTLITWALHHAFWDMPPQRETFNRYKLGWMGERLVWSLYKGF